MRMRNEKQLINKTSKSTTNQRTNPINPLIIPRPAHQRRSKAHRRVHRSSVKRSAGEDVSSDDETNGYRCYSSQSSSLWINGCGVDGVDKAKRHDDLQHESVPDGDAGEAEGAGGFAGGDAEEEAGDGGAEELSYPVEDAAEKGYVAADEGAEGYCWVDVAAGDVGGDGDGDEKAEAVCY